MSVKSRIANNKRKYEKLRQEYNTYISARAFKPSASLYKDPQRANGSTPKTQYERELEHQLYCPRCHNILKFEYGDRKLENLEDDCNNNSMGDIYLWRCSCGYNYWYTAPNCGQYDV